MALTEKTSLRLGRYGRRADVARVIRRNNALRRSLAGGGGGGGPEPLPPPILFEDFEADLSAWTLVGTPSPSLNTAAPLVGAQSLELPGKAGGGGFNYIARADKDWSLGPGDFSVQVRAKPDAWPASYTYVLKLTLNGENNYPTYRLGNIVMYRDPFAGPTAQIGLGGSRHLLQEAGNAWSVGTEHVLTLIRQMGLVAFYQGNRFLSHVLYTADHAADGAGGWTLSVGRGDSPTDNGDFDGLFDNITWAADARALELIPPYNAQTVFLASFDADLNNEVGGACTVNGTGTERSATSPLFGDGSLVTPGGSTGGANGLVSDVVGPIGLQDFTLEFWMRKVGSWVGTGVPIATRGVTAYNVAGSWWMESAGGNLSTIFYDGSVYHRVTAPTGTGYTAAVDTPVHVVVQRKAGQYLRMWVNGKGPDRITAANVINGDWKGDKIIIGGGCEANPLNDIAAKFDEVRLVIGDVVYADSNTINRPTRPVARAA